MNDICDFLFETFYSEKSDSALCVSECYVNGPSFTAPKDVKRPDGFFSYPLPPFLVFLPFPGFFNISLLFFDLPLFSKQGVTWGNGLACRSHKAINENLTEAAPQ